MQNKPRFYYLTIVAYSLIPLICSTISSIHIIRFFELSNYYYLALTLAMSAEIGALAALFGLTSLGRVNKAVVWFIFVLLTLYQIIGNVYFSFDELGIHISKNSKFINSFTELFGLSTEENSDVIVVKRIISVVEGIFLPLTSLSFLHLLVGYISASSPEENSKKDLEKSLLDEKETEKETEIESGQENAFKAEPGSIYAAPESIQKKTTTLDDKSKAGFDNFVEKKIKKLEEDKINYNNLLKVLFRDGKINKGEELNSFNDFMDHLKKEYKEKYDINIVKTFLSLLNYLEITKLSGLQRIACLNYDDAKKKLNDYLTLERE